MENLNGYLIEIAYFLLLLCGCILVYFISRRYILKLIERLVIKTENKWDDIFFEKKVFHTLAYLSPVPLIYLGSFLYPQYHLFIEKGLLVYIAINLIFMANKVLTVILTIYNSYEIAKIRPINNFIQVGKIIVYFLGTLFVLSLVFNKSILTFLSGLGALTAVLMLVFKDSLLSFKAGIQLIANDMLRVGDWIELPQYRADGDVIEISLDTIKVKNWDKTITFIPTFKLMEDSFKNWRGMTDTGGRRISRSILIDQHSVRFLHEGDIAKFQKFTVIKDYMKNKLDDIAKYNQERSINKENLFNGRRLTNLGTFRAYLLNYLKNHPNIRQDLTLLVRQLEPTSEGIPIQIYAFTNDTRWAYYENIQADIFDHILAIMPEFDLKIFQKLSQIKLNLNENNNDLIEKTGEE